MSKQRFLPLVSGFILSLAILACSLGTNNDGNGGSTAPAANTPASSGISGPCANPLLPIKVGATWNYQLTGPISDTFTRTILSVDSSGFTDQDTFGRGVIRSGKWNCDHGDLIALDPDSSGPSAYVNTTRAAGQFHTTANEGVTLPAGITIGNPWTQTVTIEGTETINGRETPAKNNTATTCQAIGVESITVPAGTFSATRLDCQIKIEITVTALGVEVPAHLSMTTSNWYAPNVGWVKSLTTTPDGESTVELVSYTIP